MSPAHRGAPGSTPSWPHGMATSRIAATLLGFVALVATAACTANGPGSDAGSVDGDAEVSSAQLNDDLVALIEQAGFEPGGGDHDYMSGSNSVSFPDDGAVAIFLNPQERAELGDVTFEQRSEEQVGDASLRVGVRSDDRPAAQFDCGDFRFVFHGDVAARVHEVARGIAEVTDCPYGPNAAR